VLYSPPCQVDEIVSSSYLSISKRSYVSRFTLGSLRNALGDAILALTPCVVFPQCRGWKVKMWIQQSLEQSETYKHRGDLRLGQPRYTPKIPRRSSLQMGQEKGMETENPKAFVSATVVSLKSVLRGVLLEDSKFCPPCPSVWWLIFCQVICDVDVVGGSIPLHGRQEYQGRSTFGLSRVTLAAPKPMPVLESSLALATFFRPTCGLSFGFSWRFRSNKRMKDADARVQESVGCRLCR
jgi:hypothetical protein